MTRATELDREQPPGNLPLLAGLAVLVGAATGLVAAWFRLSLEWVNELRNSFIDWGHGVGWLAMPLVVLACAAGTTAAAALVKHVSPHAEGSGIPRVESVVAGEIRPGGLRILPVKFIGGLLAIGSGLALGREGPSVQMGGSCGRAISRLFRRNAVDGRVLIAAGAGAGLATAFNAPVAGAVFVLEELLRRFDTRVTIATLGASGGAMATARLVLGDHIEFQAPIELYPTPQTAIVFLLLGVICGVVGAAYNATLMWVLAWSQRSWRAYPLLRAAVIGASVGIVAWYLPDLVGGGQSIVQDTFDGKFGLLALGVILAMRFGLSVISYAARTPGGLFAPMLVLGSQLGMLFGLLVTDFWPQETPNAHAFAIVAMAAFFTAVVRAPVTGMILVIEMTDAMPLLPPMLGACFVAMLVTTLLRIAPIYQSLAARARESSGHY